MLEIRKKLSKEISRQIEVSNELLICTTAGELQFTHTNLFGAMKKVLAILNKGEHNGIRFISDLNRDNVNVAKMYTDAGVQLGHAKILPTMSFHVTDKHIATTIEKLTSGTNVQSLLISDDPTYLSHFKNIFEELWENGIDATDRIRDIEEGRETDEELANTKHYIKEVLEEVTSMKHRAKQQGYDIP